MGKQYNKLIKRRRRVAYKKRKHIRMMASAKKSPAKAPAKKTVAKKAAKKAVAKKAAPKTEAVEKKDDAS